MRWGRGFTVADLAAALAVGGILVVGFTAVLLQLARVPYPVRARLVAGENLDRAVQALRRDALQALSFQPGDPPVYGTFRWRDYATFPPARHKVTYLWQEGTLSRQVTVEGVEEDPFPVARHIARPEDVRFSLEGDVLTVSLTATIDLGRQGPVQETARVRVRLRAGAGPPVEHQYFFLDRQGGFLALRPHRPGRPASLVQALTAERPVAEWSTPPLTASLTVRGAPAVFLFLTGVGFRPGERVEVRALLVHRGPGGDSPVSGGRLVVLPPASWERWSVRLNPVSYTLPAGDRLVLRLQFIPPPEEEDEGEEEEGEGRRSVGVLVAYGSTDSPSLVEVPAAP